jgi:hypothetical protein
MEFIMGDFSTEPDVNARTAVFVLKHHTVGRQERKSSRVRLNFRQLHEPTAFALGTILEYPQERKLCGIMSWRRETPLPLLHQSASCYITELPWLINGSIKKEI